MNITENEVKLAIESILTRGIVRIRNICLSNPPMVKIEADHIHNLPHILCSFSVDAIQFYYNIERADYLMQSGGGYDKTHENDWRVIERFLGLENRSEKAVK